MRRALLLAILAPGLPCVSGSFPSAVTPVALAIPAGQICNDVVTGHGYGCTIAATDGADANSRAVTTGASSFTVAGFSVVVNQGLAIIQSTAVANTTGPINFALQLSDLHLERARIVRLGVLYGIADDRAQLAHVDGSRLDVDLIAVADRRGVIVEGGEFPERHALENARFP